MSFADMIHASYNINIGLQEVELFYILQELRSLLFLAIQMR